MMVDNGVTQQENASLLLKHAGSHEFSRRTGVNGFDNQTPDKKTNAVEANLGAFTAVLKKKY